MKEVSVFDIKGKDNQFSMYCDANEMTKEEANKAFENSKEIIVKKIINKTGENFWRVSNIHLKHLTKKLIGKKYKWEGIFEVYSQCCGSLD